MFVWWKKHLHVCWLNLDVCWFYSHICWSIFNAELDHVRPAAIQMKLPLDPSRRTDIPIRLVPFPFFTKHICQKKRSFFVGWTNWKKDTRLLNKCSIGYSNRKNKFLDQKHILVKTVMANFGYHGKKQKLRCYSILMCNIIFPFIWLNYSSSPPWNKYQNYSTYYPSSMLTSLHY